MMPQGMCQPVSLRNMQKDCGNFGCHRSKPCGWGNSARELAQGRDPLALCGQRHWCTYQRHRGDCQVQGLDSRAGTSRKGDQFQNWRATDPRTGGHPPKNRTGTSLFFNLGWCGAQYTTSRYLHGLCCFFLWYSLVLSSGFSVLVVSFLPCHACALAAHLCESVSGDVVRFTGLLWRFSVLRGHRASNFAMESAITLSQSIYDICWRGFCALRGSHQWTASPRYKRCREASGPRSCTSRTLST